MRINSRANQPAIFSIADRREDIEILNAILARLRQLFHAKPSCEIYERVNAAYQAGTPLPELFAVVVRDIETLEERNNALRSLERQIHAADAPFVRTDSSFQKPKRSINALRGAALLKQQRRNFGLISDFNQREHRRT